MGWCHAEISRVRSEHRGVIIYTWSLSPTKHRHRQEAKELRRNFTVDAVGAMVLGMKLLTRAAAVLLLSLVTASCDSEDPPAPPTQADESKNTMGGDTAAKAAASAQPSAGATQSSTCPAGRWHYDYSDQALEVMMKNTINAKVVKEEGDFVCEISSGDDGTITCDTGESPVHNVVETKQGGMPMTVSVKLSGKGSTRFKRLAEGRLQVTDSDTKNLKLETSVTLAGKSIPFPGKEMVGLFGGDKAILSYKCQDGKLLLKPELDDTETTWQELLPVE